VEKVSGNRDLITGEEQSSEERSPRALRAERSFQGFEKAHTVQRVAKPWRRDFWETRQRFSDAFGVEGEKRGA
jgi:hypothetical protein